MPIPIIPVLAALIKNKQGEFLIARRKTALSNGGKWEFPGGKLLAGETPEECLAREIKEEMGIDIDVLNPFHIVNHSSQTKSILLIAYTCNYNGGKIALRDHDQIAWVEPAQAIKYHLSEADKPIAEKLGQAKWRAK